VFYFSTIPEITDADMAFQAEETHANADDKPFRKQYRLFHAAFSQFCYTGAQVAIASYFINYVVESRAGTSDSLAAKFLAGAQVRSLLTKRLLLQASVQSPSLLALKVASQADKKLQICLSFWHACD
jgi:fucose permease